MRFAVKKSILLSLIEKSPKILLFTAVLICILRAKPGDLPKMLEILTKSDLFCTIGWIVAIVVITIAISAVALYVKLKPKNTGL